MWQQYRDRGVWSRHIVTFAPMRELHIEMEYGTGARSYILKWCQEPYFNYCIQYSLQICRAYRYGGAPYLKVVRFTERPPHIRIWAPFRLQYGGATERPPRKSLSNLQACRTAFLVGFLTGPRVAWALPLLAPALGQYGQLERPTAGLEGFAADRLFVV
jgi:hypothetical protein